VATFAGLSPLIADPKPAPIEAPAGPAMAKPIAPVTAGRIFLNIFIPSYL
jgi:hypothetical protein